MEDKLTESIRPQPATPIHGVVRAGSTSPRCGYIRLRHIRRSRTVSRSSRIEGASGDTDIYVRQGRVWPLRKRDTLQRPSLFCLKKESLAFTKGLRRGSERIGGRRQPAAPCEMAARLRRRPRSAAATQPLFIYYVPPNGGLRHEEAGGAPRQPPPHGVRFHAAIYQANTCMLRTSKVPQATKKAMRATRSAAR